MGTAEKAKDFKEILNKKTKLKVLVFGFLFPLVGFCGLVLFCAFVCALGFFGVFFSLGCFFFAWLIWVVGFYFVVAVLVGLVLSLLLFSRPADLLSTSVA